MPREVIHYPTPSLQPFRLVIGWDRDQDVRVGIETTESADGQHHLIDQIYGEETLAIGRALAQDLAARDMLNIRYPDGEIPDALLALIGRSALDAVTGSTPFGTSVWVDTTRGCLNTLIRLARRARDAAYGKDE